MPLVEVEDEGRDVDEEAERDREEEEHDGRRGHVGGGQGPGEGQSFIELARCKFQTHFLLLFLKIITTRWPKWMWKTSR